MLQIDNEADRPTLIECVRFRGRKRRINIPQEIGIKYHDFGLFLLEDDTGARICSITHKHNNDAEQINMEILQQWITGRGKHPVTWTTLTQCLCDIELTVLAGEIEAIKHHTNRAEKDGFSKTNSAQKPLTDGPTSFGSRSTEESCIRNHEPSQQVADITCGSVQQINKNDQRNNAPHGVSEDSSIQRSVRESTLEGTKSQLPEVLAMYMQQVQKCLTSMFTKGSHSTSIGESGDQSDGNYEGIRSGSHESPPVQRDLQESTAEATKSQNAEALAAIVIQEMQKCLGHTITGITEGSDPSNVGESSIGYDKPVRQVTDVACKFVQQLKKKEENQHSSAPQEVSVDRSIQRDLRESTTEATNGQNTEVLAMILQEMLGGIVTGITEALDSGIILESGIGDGKYCEAMQQVACRFVQHMKKIQSSSACHGVSEDPAVQGDLRESTAEGTNGQNAEVLQMYLQGVQKFLKGTIGEIAENTDSSDSRSIGESDIRGDKHCETMQQVVEFACRFVQELKEMKNNHNSNILHDVGEDPPVQRGLRESNTEAPEDLNADALEVYLQEIPKCSGSVVTEATEGSHSTNIEESGIGDDRNYEAIQQIADIVCSCVEHLKEKERNQRSSAHHQDNESSLVQGEPRDKAANVSKGAEQRKDQVAYTSCTDDHEHYEAIQKIVDIAAGLPSRCSELLEALEDKSSASHGGNSVSLVQRDQRDKMAEVIVGSEQRDIPASDFPHSSQQIVDVAADLLSKCFELESLNLEREEGQRSNEGIEDRVDATTNLLHQYFETRLFSCEASNHETRRSSDPHKVSKNPPKKDTTAMGTEPRGTGDVPARGTENVWYNKALQQISDVAADLLHKCFELLDSVSPNQTLRENQGNSVPHGEQEGNGNIPPRDTKLAKCYEALQHIADIAADVLHRCFVLLDLQSLHQEKEENQESSPPLKIGDRQQNITLIPEEVLD